MEDREGALLRALLLGLAHGDEWALEALYHRLAPRLYAFLLRILGSREEAEEALQDTFLRLRREARRYDPGRGEPETFAYAIARNLALSRLRRRRREPPKDEGLDPHDPEGDRLEALGRSQGGQEERVMVQRALEALSPEERALLEGAFFQGLSHSELARRFRLPLGTVKARIRRALQKLRARLKEV